MFRYSFLAGLLLVGCNNASMMMEVTVGGNQDMNLARELIDQGLIPNRDSFSAEGLFSEHDLPLSGFGCETTLCPNTAMASMTTLDDNTHLLAQLGFDTNISADTFERRPLNISAAVDISGSMNGEKLEMVQNALLLMVDQLTEDDRMSLVTYGSRARVKRRSLQMNNYGKRLMIASINAMSSGGSTNMEEGMILAFEQVDKHLEDSNVENRVMLFTDARPNVGSTDSESFMELTRSNAEKGIGLTVFGVGLDLGAELNNAISQIRGGNAYFLSTKEYTSTLFEEEFDFIVSPIAYNLEVSLNVDERVEMERVFGAPSETEATGLSFGASSLFLSQRSGGIGVLLNTDDFSGKLGSMDIRYENLDGEIVEQTAYLQYNGGVWSSTTVDADDLGVFTMAHLINEFEALEAGADFCEGLIEQEEAIEKVALAQEKLTELIDILETEPIDRERQLIAQLRLNVESGLDNCVRDSRYGYY